jgi:protocatechuate 4,5-dioxygenase beta chain
LESYVQRINAGFATLKEQLEKAKLDALFVIGDDQGELFSDAFNPPFALFVGDKSSGSTSSRYAGQKIEDNHITLNNHNELAKRVLHGLMERGFDIAYMKKLQPLGRPAGGLGHAVVRVAKMMGTHETGLPTIPFLVNGYHPPQPTAERCYKLGEALREIFENRPERVGIYGSGGLSHCPRGPRAGWVDEPLDRWVLERIERGEGEKLKHLFTFDSDTLRSGTGEIRGWIATAGAFHGRKGTIVDYIPARHAVTGLGFAYWAL